MTNSTIIIKIGSNVLVDSVSKEFKQEVVENILSAVSERIKLGEKILVVTSGAVALGRKFFVGKDIDKRLAAALGQARLMSYYLSAANKLGLQVAEMLIARPDLTKREHFLQLQKTIDTALAMNIIPIINENDAMVVNTDWSFGDNDSLASALAIAFKANQLIILSNVNGLYTADPAQDKEARHIDEVYDINAEIIKYCSKTASDLGRGGMNSKLRAAKLCTAVGIKTTIVNGRDNDEIKKVLAGEKGGTVFTIKESAKVIKNRQRWILAAKSTTAVIEVDAGAEQALRVGKSLLAVGIKQICGNFASGDIVEVNNQNKEILAFGVAEIDSNILMAKPFNLQKNIQVMHADNIITLS